MFGLDYYNLLIIIVVLAMVIVFNVDIARRYEDGEFRLDLILPSVLVVGVVMVACLLGAEHRLGVKIQQGELIGLAEKDATFANAKYNGLVDELNENGVSVINGELNFDIRDDVLINTNKMQYEVVKNYGYALKNTKSRYGLTVNDLILIEIFCNKYKVSMDLYLAILYTESRYNSSALQSHTGAIGIAQILPSTAKDIHIRVLKRDGDIDPNLMYDKAIAFEYSIAYIRDCIDVANGNVWKGIKRYKGATSMSAYKAEISKLNRYIISVKGTSLASIINWEGGNK